jgi:hypothetical protein
MLYIELLGAGFSILWYVVLYKVLIPHPNYRLVKVSTLLALQLFGGVYILVHPTPCTIHEAVERTIGTTVVIRMGCVFMCMITEMALPPLLASAACGVYAIASTIRTLSTCGLVAGLVEFALLTLSVLVAIKQQT